MPYSGHRELSSGGVISLSLVWVYLLGVEVLGRPSAWPVGHVWVEGAWIYVCYSGTK